MLKATFSVLLKKVKQFVSHLFVMVVAECRLLGSGAVPFTDGLFHVRVSGDKDKQPFILTCK